MRDPNRLDTFYETLKEIHKTYFPDWRFGQFIINFQGWYYDKYHRDVFYVEDGSVLDDIKDFAKALHFLKEVMNTSNE